VCVCVHVHVHVCVKGEGGGVRSSGRKREFVDERTCLIARSITQGRWR